MGVVYQAKDSMLGECAIKMIRPQWDESSSKSVVAQKFTAALNQLELEAKTMGRVACPYLIAVRDFLIFPDPHSPIGQNGAMVMECLPASEGWCNLFEQMVGQGPFTTDAALFILEKVQIALSALRQAGIDYRDLKPDNIMYSAEAAPHVKLIDSGVANWVRPEVESESDGIIGTICFLSPERIEKKYSSADRDVTERSDVFITATVLYEMLTGRVLFYADSANDILRQIVACDRYVGPRLAEMTIPDSAKVVFRHALQYDAQLRYPTVKEFLAAIRPALQSDH
jgi:serine/threonine-protein kinase